jgi:uncharacterized metal-binding protein YceD (DUF177 family)
MRIAFGKVSQTKKPFELTIDTISLKGSLVKRGYHRVLLDANLNGVIDLVCDRCGDEFKDNVNSSLNLTLSDEIIETQDDLDIIEFLDGVVDIEFIIQSEIASIQNSYHICHKCENDKSEFEKEF